MTEELFLLYPVAPVLIWLALRVLDYRLTLAGYEAYRNQGSLIFEIEYVPEEYESAMSFILTSLAGFMGLLFLFGLCSHLLSAFWFSVLAGTFLLPYAHNMVLHFQNLGFFGDLARCSEEAAAPLELSANNSYRTLAWRFRAEALLFALFFAATGSPLFLGGVIGGSFQALLFSFIEAPDRPVGIEKGESL